MKIESAEFVGSAKGLEDCPRWDGPEFAFIGRSNVGKSSLINALTGKKELAHTSRKPGKTQRIHLFRINHIWHLVDLPGYGYAKVSKAKQKGFNRDVSGYLTGRGNLKHVFLLVDSQIELQEGDVSFAEWLRFCEIEYSVVLTKTDRGSDGKAAEHARRFMEALKARDLGPAGMFFCSAKTGKGRAQILEWIESRLPAKKQGKRKGGGIRLDWMRSSLSPNGRAV